METGIELSPLSPTDFPDGMGYLATSPYGRAIRNLATSYRQDLIAGVDEDFAVDKSIRWARAAGIPRGIESTISVVALSELIEGPEGSWIYDNLSEAS
jgi:hypothetical protein